MRFLGLKYTTKLPNITCILVATGVILQRLELYLLNETLVTLVVPNNNRMQTKLVEYKPSPRNERGYTV